MTLTRTAPLPSIFDTRSVAGLKTGMQQGDPQALKAAAQQFEAIFLQMMLKSMRDATPQSGLFDSEQTRLYQELLDSQLSQAMAARGGTGLSAVIERQLRQGPAVAPDAGGLPLTPPARAYPIDRSTGLPFAVPPAPTFQWPGRTNASPAAAAADRGATRPGSGAADADADAVARSFATALWPQALAASRQTGIPPQFLVAHAALESGWGKHEPRDAGGRPSYNLFGIKAGGQWSGDSVAARTSEFAEGVETSRVERFRAYRSYAEGFADYAALLAQSPRYAAVVGQHDAASFAAGLQRAGYASDPHYANKLRGVIDRLDRSLNS